LGVSDEKPGAQHGGLIDKTVLGQVTRLRLLQPIDRSFRWGRVLDGLEGVVELDVSAARLDAAAVEAMRAALRNLDPAVTAVSVAGVPGAFAYAGAIARCTIASYVVDGRCTTCRARRSALIGSDELHAMLVAGRVDVRCRRCDTPLEQEAAPPAREVALGPRMTSTAREAALGPQVTTRRRGGPWQIIAVAVLAVATGGIAARVVWHPRPAARDAAQVILNGAVLIDQPGGLHVSLAPPGGPLAAGDHVISVDGRAVFATAELDARALAARREVVLVIERQGSSRTVVLRGEP